jgi:anti-sigma factor RsiW
MKDFERTELMHAVLDGEATPDEARELEHLLATNPAARAQFEELRSLFDALSRVPKAFPPEGLVAAVLASVPQRPVPADDSAQLFVQSRVISQSSMEAREASPGRSTVHRASPRGTYIREQSMSEQKSGLGRRKLLIGGGIAAVAALFAVLYITDSPPGMQNAVGTIVPAQRYRAPQNTADDVKLGNQSSPQSQQLSPASQTAIGSAANSAAGNALDSATSNAPNSAASNALNSATSNAPNSAAGNALNSATSNAPNSAAGNALNSATSNAPNSAAGNALNSATSNATNSAANNAVNNAVDNTANSAAKK